MSLDTNKFKNVKNKNTDKLVTVIVVCIILTPFLGPLPIFYMFYYIIKNANKLLNIDYKIDNQNGDYVQEDNLYEELKDNSTKDYYKYDINDISQEEIHEHREDFWNVNSPIKYK